MTGPGKNARVSLFLVVVLFFVFLTMLFRDVSKSLVKSKILNLEPVYFLNSFAIFSHLAIIINDIGILD